MERITLKKIAVSYVITSFMIFVISAITSMLGIYGKDIGYGSVSMSVELMAVIQLTIVLVSNFLLHLVFYFGGFNSSPITRGIGIGAVLGLTYFMVTVFVLNEYNITTDPLRLLLGAMGGRMAEYSAGGIATAVISVTDVHRWGLLKAF